VLNHTKSTLGTLDGEVSNDLDTFMRTGWTQPAEPRSPQSPPSELTRSRRASIRRLLEGRLAIITSGFPAHRVADQFYPFRPDSDYVWLTGDQSVGGVLVLGATEEETALYIQAPFEPGSRDYWRDPSRSDLWVGTRPCPDKRSSVLGLTCHPRGELSGRLDEHAVVRRAGGPDPSVDEALGLCDLSSSQALREILSDARLVKDTWEIDQLRLAISATTTGFHDVASSLRSGTATSERHVDAAFAFHSRLAGNTVGYATVAAAGSHATTLHWTTNNGPLRPGELLLVDAGIEVETLYTADITRTVPINGRFTSAQREVYEIVLAAQEAAIQAVRPGRHFQDFYAESSRVLAEGLESLGVLPIPARQSLEADSGLHRRWTLCPPGHMLGLDVHDCGTPDGGNYRKEGGVLSAGNVLTIEPGLYFQANDDSIHPELRGIGIRIEDDFLVTADGCHLMSDGLPRSVDDIEAWVA